MMLPCKAQPPTHRREWQDAERYLHGASYTTDDAKALIKMDNEIQDIDVHCNATPLIFEAADALANPRIVAVVLLGVEQNIEPASLPLLKEAGIVVQRRAEAHA